MWQFQSLLPLRQRSRDRDGTPQLTVMWYDLREDPHELVNLARDPGHRAELRANYERLLEYEIANFSV